MQRETGPTVGTTGQHPRAPAWFDDLPLPSLLLNGAGQVLASNRLAIDFFGPGARDGLSPGTFFETVDGPLPKALLTGLLTAPDRVEAIEVSVQAGGRLAHCRVHLKTMRAGGEPDALLLQIQDLTDITAREAEHVRSKSRWNLALASAKTGIWEFDLRSGQQAYADSWKTLRGLGPGDSLPASLDEIMVAIHPDDRDRVLDMVLRQRDGDQSCNVYDYRLRRPDGSWLWIECRTSAVEWGSNGDPLFIVGTDIDITDRKRSEEALERLSRRLSIALEASGIGVFEFDFETGLCQWDAGMFRVYRLEETKDVEVSGFWEATLHPDDKARILARVDHHVASLMPFSDDYRVILEGGDVRDIRMNALPFVDADGHRRMIGVNWDVSDDRNLRRALEDARRVAEARNRDLENAKAEIERMALLDPLTGLPNRRYLDNQLVRMKLDPDTVSEGMAVLHIDLDRFKQINDTFGHDVGDRVLKQAASVLRDNTRSGDFVVRIGGDEFVLYAPGLTDPDDLSSLADRIITTICQPIRINQIECQVGCSIGIAVGRGEDIDLLQVQRNADIALYVAKNKGRSRFEFFVDATQ
ncbi:diguanylate cyclase (GGDEF)-like protein/PAS domain S-box-containing protein [Rhizobium sp. SG_E_25_P2]|uniref:sensor domain-containing protein n=1 Tax=Rhizobium sp. SG_E_25_P2 TaxID=2879942 RepID=UPI002472F658|nr:diguanylate cyclase [Rhizobium sp. SG_E_25_P2]MDH6268122.1 diguanylate cyclase (GGDEF)-like protein/PAS domain S-box-containing protein [Rhizobium sp. SG_E_25_P2]